jgi:hypothetical protein
MGFELGFLIQIDPNIPQRPHVPMKSQTSHNPTSHRFGRNIDAEDPAEAGIKKAYQSILKILRQHLSETVQVHGAVDNHAPSYVVRCGKQEYVIYSHALSDDEGQQFKSR